MKKNLFTLLFVISAGVFSQDVYNFSLKNTEQVEVSYNDLKGENLTIIDFWATWCAPCKNSIPKINQLYNDYKEKGVQIIGISVDSPRNRAKIRPFVKAMGIKYPILIDEDQEVLQEFNVNAIPVLFVVNNEDEIVYIHEGYTPGDDLEIKEKIEELLNQ